MPWSRVRISALAAAVALSIPWMGNASDLVPLDLSFPDPVWIQSAGILQAAAGEMPTRLTGVHTVQNFSAYLDARVTAGPDFLTVELSGTATSFQTANDGVGVSLNAPVEVVLTMPGTSGIGQAFVDFEVSTSPGWRVLAEAGVALGPGAAIVEGVGPVSLNQNGVSRGSPTGAWVRENVLHLTAPAGRDLRIPLYISVNAQTTDQTPGPFTVTATLRAKAAAPALLGDVNGDGLANLVDSVVFRRMLVGALVP